MRKWEVMERGVTHTRVIIKQGKRVKAGVITSQGELFASKRVFGRKQIQFGIKETLFNQLTLNWWFEWCLTQGKSGRDEEDEEKRRWRKKRNETVQEGFLLCVYWRRSRWRSREGDKKKKIRVLTTVTLTDLKILERTLMRKRPLFREGRLSSRHKGDIGEKEDDSRSRDLTLCLLMHVIPVCELHSFHHDNWLDSFIFVISYLLIWFICCKDDCRKRGDEEGETYEVILSSASSK